MLKLIYKSIGTPVIRSYRINEKAKVYKLVMLLFGIGELVRMTNVLAKTLRWAKAHFEPFFSTLQQTPKTQFFSFFSILFFSNKAINC